MAFYVIKRDKDDKIMVSNGKGKFVFLPEDIFKDEEHCLIRDSFATFDKRFLFLLCNESLFGVIFDIKNNKFLEHRISMGDVRLFIDTGNLIPEFCGPGKTCLLFSKDGNFFIIKSLVDKNADIEIINLKSGQSVLRKNDFSCYSCLTGITDENFEKIAEQKVKFANCSDCRYRSIRERGNYFHKGIFCEGDGVYNDHSPRDSISKKKDRLLVVEVQKKLFVSFDFGKKKVLLPTKNGDSDFRKMLVDNCNNEFVVIQYSYPDSNRHMLVFDNTKKEVSKLFPDDLIAKEEDSVFKKSHAYSEKEDSGYIIMLQDGKNLYKNLLYKKNYTSGVCQKIDMDSGRTINEWNGIRNWPAI